MSFNKTLIFISNEISEIPFSQNFLKTVSPDNLGASSSIKWVFRVKIFININWFWDRYPWCI